MSELNDKDEVRRIIEDPSTHPWTAVSEAKATRDSELIKLAYRKQVEWLLSKNPSARNTGEALKYAFYLEDHELIQRAEVAFRNAIARTDKTPNQFVDDVKQEAERHRILIEKVLELPTYNDPTRNQVEEYMLNDSLNIRACALEFAHRLNDTGLNERVLRATYLLMRETKPELPEEPDWRDMYKAFLEHQGDSRFDELAAEAATIMGDKALELEARKRVLTEYLSHKHLSHMVESYARKHGLERMLGRVEGQLGANGIRILHAVNRAKTALTIQGIGRDTGNLDLVRHGQTELKRAGFKRIRSDNKRRK